MNKINWHKKVVAPAFPSLPGYFPDYPGFSLPIWVNRSKPHQKQRQAKGDVFARESYYAPGIEGHALRQARAVLSNVAGTIIG